MRTLLFYRTDDKTAAEYNLVAGDTLHLVLALRGDGTLNNAKRRKRSDMSTCLRKPRGEW